MSEGKLRIVQVTDVQKQVVEPQRLVEAERVHRNLRPQLPVDYPRMMRQVFRNRSEMYVAVLSLLAIGVTVFREFENTHVGRRFYIDDLVTEELERSTVAGRALITHLEQVGRDRGCPGLDLESGTHRTRAHRFYFRKRFFSTAFSFGKEFR